MTQALGNDSSTQLLQKSWFNSAGIPSLNKQTALDYFSQRSNPFYDRTCNNEVIKMQRADPEQLTKMTGIEYMLLHVQEPILYIIRKQHRQTPERGEFSRAALATLSLRTALQERPEYYYAVCTVVTPLADYYILGGVVYQCPDLWSVINSRMLSALHCVHEAFTEITSYAHYDPSKGYSWVFPSNPPSEEVKQPPDGVSEEQRRRVDKLLSDLVQRFPPKAFARKDGGKPDIQVGSEKAGKDEESIKHPESDLNKLPDPKKKKLS